MKFGLVACLCVMGGSALGGLARYLIGIALGTWLAPFPIATVIINMVGSFAIGAIAGWTHNRPPELIWNEFLAIGVLGGFTTFSSFSLQTLTLLRSGQKGAAALNVLLSVGLSLGAVAAGYALASARR